jgi:hypothetical protein
MQTKRTLPVLGASFFLLCLFLLTMAACSGNQKNPIETDYTWEASTSEDSVSDLPAVSEPAAESSSTQPGSVTEPATQAPVKEPDTLSAEEESILSTLYDSWQKAYASQRVLSSSTMTVSLDVAGAGVMKLTETSRFVCADGNYAAQYTSGDTSASATLFGNFLYASTVSGDKMKAYLTTEEDREAVIVSVFDGDADSAGLMDAELLRSLRGVKRVNSESGTAITADSMDQEVLLALFKQLGLDADFSLSSAAGRFQLNQDGLPVGMAIRVTGTLQAGGQTMSLSLDITTVYDYSESVKVTVPDNTGAYTDVSLAQLLEQLGSAETPDPGFTEVPTEPETTSPDIPPVETETEPAATTTDPTPTTPKVMYVTADSLWVRSSPVFTGDSNKIGFLRKGAQIEVLEMTDTYCSFLYNGSVAYVGVKYLSETPPAAS